MSASVSSPHHRPRMSPSPPSSFTPPRDGRQPGPSPPPSPSPARLKGKGRALSHTRPTELDEQLNYGNRSPSKKQVASTSRSSSVTRSDRRTNGQGPVGRPAHQPLVREERLKGDARLAHPPDSDEDDENGWGWEEEHTWGEVSSSSLIWGTDRTGRGTPSEGFTTKPSPSSLE